MISSNKENGQNSGPETHRLQSPPAERPKNQNDDFGGISPASLGPSGSNPNSMLHQTSTREQEFSHNVVEAGPSLYQANRLSEPFGALGDDIERSPEPIEDVVELPQGPGLPFEENPMGLLGNGPVSRAA